MEEFFAKYNELSDGDKGNIVVASTDLLKAITKAFGPEHGLKLWDDLANCLGAEIKGDVFINMLTGESCGEVTITSTGPNFINCIKTIRTYSGMGLKEAKDLADIARSGGTAKFRILNSSNRAQCLRDFAAAGCTAK